MRILEGLVGLCLAGTLACEPPTTPEAPANPLPAQTPAATQPQVAPAANGEPSAAATTATEKGDQLVAPKSPDEACALILSVAFEGAKDAPEGLRRDEAAAKQRAEKLRSKVLSGADFRELAAEESDAASKVRRGAIGTFARDQWPDKHAALADAVFALKVNEVSPVVKAPYGYTFVKRCKVEKVHTRHVLVRYAGALRAPDDLQRTREQAEALAMEIYAKAKAGASFQELAEQHSEDGSAERGGDLGVVGRGLFVPPYEEAAFALRPGGISAPVESEFGFHVIQRVE